MNLGRVGMGRVLCGPSWHGPSWFWAELSVIHKFGPSWHGPSFMWAELAWAELVLGRVVRNSFSPLHWLI